METVAGPDLPSEPARPRVVTAIGRIWLVLGIFYFVMILPMRKRQQKVQEFQSGLKVGDKVITSGGIFGSITRVSEQSVQLQVANNVRIEVSRPAIVGFQGQEPVVPEGNQQ